MNDDATPLDAAHHAMQADPHSDAARMRFHERLAESELFLLLEREAAGETIEPRLFPLEDGPVVLVFDREERLAGFVGGEAYFAAMSGRQVVKLLRGQGIGLGVNLGVEGGETVLPAASVEWLGGMLDHGPQEAEDRPREVSVPGTVPERLLTALDAKLATAAGRARLAYLGAVTYESGRSGHVLAFVDAVPGAERALAAAAAEALAFSGLEAGEMDVMFLPAADPLSARLAKVGLRFDLPQAEPPEMTELSPPGMDPDDPPILR